MKFSENLLKLNLKLQSLMFLALTVFKLLNKFLSQGKNDRYPRLNSVKTTKLFHTTYYHQN